MGICYRCSTASFIRASGNQMVNRYDSFTGDNCDCDDLFSFKSKERRRLSDSKCILLGMAKRVTGVGRQKNTHSHKTVKRLEIKRLMLVAKIGKHHIHNRKIAKGKLKARN